jgi:signal transduction histidine kinase
VELEKALAARTEFLATTSHEIRTPLNGILGMTQVLLADRGIDPPVREKIQLVHGAGQTMKALVDDILDVAKMTSGEIRIDKAPMKLRTLLRDAVRVWEGQAATKGITDRACRSRMRRTRSSRTRSACARSCSTSCPMR